MSDERATRLKEAEEGLRLTQNKDTPTKVRVKKLLGGAVGGGGGVIFRGGLVEGSGAGRVEDGDNDRREEFIQEQAERIRQLERQLLEGSQQISSARTLMEAAMEAQKFVAEQAHVIEKMGKEKIMRDIELGRKEELVEKLEKEKKALQQEQKHTQAQAADYKRRAGVLGFQVKKLLGQMQKVKK